MKKSVKSSRRSVSKEQGPDIAGLITAMQQQLSSLERKVDILISRSSHRPAEVRHFPLPTQRYNQTQPQQQHQQQQMKQENGNRERVLHKAVCADCGSGCEVPFKPSGDRPVYCKECYSKRRNRNPSRDARDNRPAETPPSRELVGAAVAAPVAEHHPVEKKKKTVSKRRKK